MKRSDAYRRHDDLAKRIVNWLSSYDRVSHLNRQIVFTTKALLAAGTGYAPQMTTSQARACGQASVLRSRPDIISLKRTADRRSREPWIVEVKTRRADFLADVNRPDKRGAYFFLAEKVFYGVPLGLVDPSEVPFGTGLITESPGGDIAIAVDAPRRTIRHHAHISRIFPPEGLRKILASSPLNQKNWWCRR
jgi:hypothetical protein